MNNSVLNSKVLILNKSYLPIHVTTVKRAFILFYQGAAKAVDENYQTYDFDSWRDVEIKDAECINTSSGKIKIPRVLLIHDLDKNPSRRIKFSRYNIYTRDKFTCQYCGSKLPRTELNLDHVTPRSRGGMSTWSNVVCACQQCNSHKAGRTPEEAKMKLIRQPRQLEWVPFSGEKKYKEWQPFISTFRGDID